MVSYLHQLSAVVQKIKKIDVENAPSNDDAILDEFSHQDYHQSINKNTIFNAKLAFFLCKYDGCLMHILVGI